MSITYFLLSLFPELPNPEIFRNDISSIAGQPFSTKCNYTVIDNLITDPTIHWVNSIDFIVSSTSTLSLTPLMTSDGGQYTCIVNINITELNISFTGSGTTILKVQSEFLRMIIVRTDSNVLCDYNISVTQYLHQLLTLQVLVCHSMVQCMV